MTVELFIRLCVLMALVYWMAGLPVAMYVDRKTGMDATPGEFLFMCCIWPCAFLPKDKHDEG